MLVILANRQDEAAMWLAERWKPHGAALLTSADLSTMGWRFHLPSSGNSRAIISGQQVAVNDITGVLTRMPSVYEQELGHVIPGDRQYVASEMTAFLLAWLSNLTCPVLNRPVPNCLAGPNWRSEQWVHLAAQLSIPVRPVQRKIPGSSDGPSQQPNCKVIVVGDRCFGNASPTVFARARLLAKTAGVDLLAAHFTGPEPEGQLVSASVWPDLTSPEVADAVLQHLLGRSAC
jgi:hypothetical protein